MRRSTIAVVGVVALLGGITMAMTNAPGSVIGFFAVSRAGPGNLHRTLSGVSA